MTRGLVLAAALAAAACHPFASYLRGYKVKEVQRLPRAAIDLAASEVLLHLDSSCKFDPAELRVAVAEWLQPMLDPAPAAPPREPCLPARFRVAAEVSGKPVTYGDCNPNLGGSPGAAVAGIAYLFVGLPICLAATAKPGAPTRVGVSFDLQIGARRYHSRSAAESRSGECGAQMRELANAVADALRRVTADARH